MLLVYLIESTTNLHDHVQLSLHIISIQSLANAAGLRISYQTPTTTSPLAGPSPATLDTKKMCVCVCVSEREREREREPYNYQV
jgi:hypothetical protein